MAKVVIWFAQRSWGVGVPFWENDSKVTRKQTTASVEDTIEYVCVLLGKVPVQESDGARSEDVV